MNPNYVILFFVFLHVLQFAMSVVVMVQVNNEVSARVPATLSIIVNCFITMMILIFAYAKYIKDRRAAMAAVPLPTVNSL
jgi:hypothetical protein